MTEARCSHCGKPVPTHAARCFPRCDDHWFERLKWNVAYYALAVVALFVVLVSSLVEI